MNIFFQFLVLSCQVRIVPFSGERGMDGMYYNSITHNKQCVNIQFVAGCNIMNPDKRFYANTISLKKDHLLD